MNFRVFSGSRSSKSSGVVSALALLASAASAQTSGPIKPPPSSPSAPQPVIMPQPAAPAEETPKPLEHSSGAVRAEQPKIPLDQIIQKFAERELEFKKERDNFTYS